MNSDEYEAMFDLDGHPYTLVSTRTGLMHAIKTLVGDDPGRLSFYGVWNKDLELEEALEKEILEQVGA